MHCPRSHYKYQSPLWALHSCLTLWPNQKWAGRHYDSFYHLIIKISRANYNYRYSSYVSMQPNIITNCDWLCDIHSCCNCKSKRRRSTSTRTYVDYCSSQFCGSKVERADSCDVFPYLNTYLYLFPGTVAAANKGMEPEVGEAEGKLCCFVPLLVPATRLPHTRMQITDLLLMYCTHHY